MNGGPFVCAASVASRASSCADWAGPGPAASGSGLVEDRLDGELDLDLVADQQLAAVERDVEVDTEVLAVDLGGRLETDPGVAVGVLLDTEELHVEVHGVGDALDGELAGGGGAVEGRGHERHRAALLHVEEVGRAQVAVA